MRKDFARYALEIKSGLMEDQLTREREKRPSWFKAKAERREIVRQMEPDTVKKVLLACYDYLETREAPSGLSPIENLAFSAFYLDLEEAWTLYLKRATRNSSIEQPHTD